MRGLKRSFAARAAAVISPSSWSLQRINEYADSGESGHSANAEDSGIRDPGASSTSRFVVLELLSISKGSLTRIKQFQLSRPIAA